MTQTNIRSLIEQYMGKAVLMQVATAYENKPWVCSVYFAYDEQLSLYWISSKTRRHSKEITHNPYVSGAIVLPHTPGDDVEGIQFEGTAKELIDPVEAAVGMKHYATRFSMPDDRVDAILNGSDGHVCYRIQPAAFVLFDEVHFPHNPRQVYLLPNTSV